MLFAGPGTCWAPAAIVINGCMCVARALIVDGMDPAAAAAGFGANMGPREAVKAEQMGYCVLFVVIRFVSGF